ncbi:LacI family DNA-binding transcriptional regulator [Paracoccus sp. NGMCC 1.201697]|uniref:LacI family DNA-binding transcriptional regulator n=1 Tax=Paracoccus broussonetiae subsp. drimophilus TaxID=3373869 RepID=A0ABW7LIU9_9RHOB
MQKDPPKAITLRQVAARAGVSAATASLVLNGKGEISEATRLRVLESIEHFNYMPRRARPRDESATTIRFLKIARHGHTVNRDHNHFIADYIDGMSHEATRRGYSLQVVSLDAAEIPDIAASLRDGGLRGAVILGTELSQAEVRQIAALPRPMVFIDTYHPFLNLNFVDMDNDQAVHSAVEHLAGCGFTRIGMVGSDAQVTNFALRRRAFSQAMQSLGLHEDPDAILSVDSTLEGAHRDSLQQLSGRSQIAQAYFCANDIIAHGFIRALRETGHDVPGDVSVVGFDNLPMSAMTQPALTSINVPKRRIGTMAIRLLDDLLQARKPQPASKVLITGELIVRDSTRPAHPPEASPRG